jgi:signal peptidase I
MMKKLIHILAAMLVALAATSQITVPLRFDRYLTYPEINEAIKALNKAYPNLTKAVLVGKSDENREIWALEINNPKTGIAMEKPGVYVDGNIHGNEIQAGEVVLYVADYLLKNYGKNPELTRIVDKNAFYLVPVVNVDGRHHFMTNGHNMNSSRSIRVPRDDDKDGLFDEDGPDDLDGDGNICRMRIKDPNGTWKTDPNEPRLMVRVKEGEKGEWTVLGLEGIDNDKDGRINEDAEGFLDPNRNWGNEWQPNYVQRGSGNYPFEGVGLKALAEYIQDRRNIIVVYAFHNTGGMFLRGPGSKLAPPYNQADIAVYDLLGKHAEKMVPGYRYLISWKDLYTTFGDFTDFTHSAFGAYSFVGELFMSEQETYSTDKAAETDDWMWQETGSSKREIERLKFNDNVVHGSLFKEWTPFKHPVYGDIEIGGWIKYSSRMPHPFMLTDMVHRNAAAVIYAAGQTPEIVMELVETKKLDGNLYQVDIRVKNLAGIPSLSYHAAKKKIHPHDMLRLNGAKVVAGGEITDRFNNKVAYKKHKPELQFLQVPGFGMCEFRFLVEGSNAFTVLYESVKAGKKTLQVKMK